MLEFIRTRVKNSIFVKAFLLILMGSFGIWGVGDFMGPSRLSPGVTIKVGSTEIKTEVVQRRFTREMERMREAMGSQAIPDEIIKRSVMSALMENLTRSATLNAASRDVGLVVTREQLRDMVVKDAAFQENGAFNQLKFEQVLVNNSLTEASYLELFESDLRQTMLMQPAAANVAAPGYLVDRLFEYRSETRVADTLFIPNASIALQTVPKDEDLKAVYDKNISSFTAPEYRKLTVLTLNALDLAKPESIEESAAKAYYDENLARYRTPQTRHIVQMVFDDKAKADAARAQAAPGDGLAALAAKIKSPGLIDLGPLPVDSALSKTIGPAFDGPIQEISQPVETPLGWHLFEVTAITPESAQPFDQVKDSIRKTLAADKGADAVYDASVRLEDALASGTALADAAKLTGARLVQIDAIDRDGNDPREIAVANLIDPKNLLTTAFATAEGKDSRLMDLPAHDGYYVVHVDKVTPPTPKPLIDVRPRVAALWEAGARAAEAKTIADKLAGELGPSTQMSALEVKDKRASYAPLGPLTRFGEGLERQHVVDSNRVSPELLDQLFKSKVGDVFVAPVLNGVVVARLKEVTTPKPVGNLAAQHAQLAQGVRDDIGRSVLDQISQAFAGRYAVEVDTKAIDNLTGTASGSP